MHATIAGAQRKELKAAIRKLKRDVEILREIGEEDVAAQREAELKRLDEAADKLWTASRLEDVHVWRIEKTKGNRTYAYWMVSWREGEKVRNVHLGSCAKLSYEVALAKARAAKAEALRTEPSGRKGEAVFQAIEARGSQASQREESISRLRGLRDEALHRMR